MDGIAVDVVLLPSAAMTEIAIQANRRLIKSHAGQILLDSPKDSAVRCPEDLRRTSCLPHISLAMGCIRREDIAEVERILKDIAAGCPVGRLRAVGLQTSLDSAGRTVCCFEVEKTAALQRLHEEVMRRLSRYFSHDVTADMLYDAADVDDSTLAWIRGYPAESSFERFSPHITIGYGQLKTQILPVEFDAPQLALCHLGSHCTCRKLLAAADLAI